MRLLLVTLLFVIVTGSMGWVQTPFLQRIVLAFSNSFAFPALWLAFENGIWFEGSYLAIMSSVSFVYHIFYGWTGDLGVWLRRTDWIFALSTGPIFLNYFFAHKTSYYKMMVNFWILAILAVVIEWLMLYPVIYVIPFAIYLSLLYFTRRRHFGDLEKKLLVPAVIWSVVGVTLFYVSDFALYWLLHSYWHVCIFVGLYYLLLMGPLDVAEKPEIHVPIIQPASGRLVIGGLYV